MKRLKNQAFLSKGGNHHVERTGVLVIPFGVSRLKTSSAGAFSYLLGHSAEEL